MMHPQTAEYLRQFADGMITLSELQRRVSDEDANDISAWLENVVIGLRRNNSDKTVILLREYDQTCD